MNKTIIGAAIGNCVHIAGIHHFLKSAEIEGYKTTLLGSAISIHQIIETIKEKKPTFFALSYRLTPEVASILFQELKQEIEKENIYYQQLIFGGTPSVAKVAEESGIFKKVFNGKESIEEIKAFLTGAEGKDPKDVYAQNLIERVNQKYPYPILRHHFGRPSLDETLKGIHTIAKSGVLDVISIGPDQNAQEFFFHPELMDHSQDGAGGVPLRHPEDLKSILAESRCGNFPLIRCYAGTRDLLRWAKMSVETIHNAWGAIPLCWYSEIDNRSTRTIEEAITEHLQVINWYAEQGIPVEVNESHQWSLRDAHDSLAVAMAFLAAYNAKRMGVRNYISQFMLNTPPGTSSEMDLAKMLAKKELIEELEDDSFSMYREVRAGLSHFSSNLSIAKGQLAASALLGLALKPHIYHVVGYSEGDHACFPDELIESCEIVHGVFSSSLNGMPSFTNSEAINQRKQELKSEAHSLLELIRRFGSSIAEDPWSSPKVIAKAIKIGILDTPHFKSNPNLCGKITTRLINGAWYAIDKDKGTILREKERISSIIENSSNINIWQE